MEKEADSFAKLLDAIADGTPIDWEKVDASPHLRAEELRAAKALAAMRDTSELGTGDAGGEPAGTDLVRGFELLAELGRGAFGRVWRARDRVLGREVALKVLADEELTPEQRATFLREARVLARCESANVVRIHAVEERTGRLELVLELIDGVTLSELVEADGVRSAEEAARIGIEICRALATIHALGLVHRDVKPANVMRGPGGRIVLLDFGLAHATDLSQRTGPAAGGTPRFIAPELIRGGGTLDGRVDLYALGVTLYWLVTAKWPHEATTRDEILEKIEREPPIPLIDRRADLPADFVGIVERALQRDPERRFASAGAMEAALREFVAGAGKGGGKDADGAPKRWWRAAAIAAASAVLLATAFFATRTHVPDASVALLRRSEGSGVAGSGFVALTRDASLHEGDSVIAELDASESTCVYAFLLDDSDECSALFPTSGTETRNPLPAGRVRLPGSDASGNEFSWNVEHPSSQYRLLFFVASRADATLDRMWNVASYEATRAGAKKTARPPTKE